VGNDPFHLPGGDLLRKMLGGNPDPPKEIPKATKKTGGGGRRPASAPEATEELLPPENLVEPKDEKPKVILRNPKWEAEDVGFNEETEISVEAELPPELAKKTAVLFELSAKAPNGPERISQADGFVEDGKAKAMIPVFQPQYREEDGSIPTKVEYRFTAKHSHSNLLKDDKAIRIVDHMAGQVIDTHILQDITFALDKSFVRTQEVAPIKEMFQRIQAWQEDYPTAKMAVFGHTDALGDEPYNKTLSEKRAKAIHALLIQAPKTWLALYDEEKWGLASTQEYLKHLGHDPGAIDGQDGPKTQAAVKEFQESKGLAATGKADAGMREALYAAFMESCEGFKVEDKKFDSIDGSPFMGCSEFNLVKQTQGASEENRRVAVFLLKSNKNFPIHFPCKKKDIGPCKQQVARKGERRTKGFSCFFYDKLVDESAILPVPGPKGKAAPQILVDVVAAAPVADAAAVAPADAPAADAAPGNAAAAGATPAPEAAAAAPAAAPKDKGGPGAAGDAVPDPVIGPNKLVALVSHPGIGAAAATLKLKTDIAYDGTGLFTRSDANIDFFRKGSATALKFDGTDNKFTGAQLTAGVDLEARGVKASAKAEEITLTLTLNGGKVKPGPPAKTKATSVEVTLDICEPRVDAATPPVKLPTLVPNAPVPAPAAATDKVFLGRPLPLQSAPKKIEERAMLIVQKVKPADFKGTLVLNVENDKLALFTDEETKAGEAPRPLPIEIDIAGIPADGKKFFVEGAKVSAAARDTGVTLGIKGVPAVADKAKITICHTEICSNKKPADLKVVAQAPEKPARATKSTFVPAPLIMGLKYDIEMRPFIEIAKPKAFKWKSVSDKLKLKNDALEVVGCHGEKLSAALDDALLELTLTTDIGKLKKRHMLTVITAEMNPVTTGTNLKHTDPINQIVNPSGCVILAAGAAADQVPIYQITKIVPDLAWTDDDTRLAWWVIGGEAKADEKYDGKADFLNTDAGKYGKKIQVFGTQLGDVLIQPYSGGYGFGMFRAHAAPIKQVKFRINRIITTAQAARPAIPALPLQAAQPPFPGGGGVAAQPAVPAAPAITARPALVARAARAPTASHAEAQLHMKVVNIYLRQAGIEMVPDTSAEMAQAPKAAAPALPATPATPAQAAQVATPLLPGVPPMPAVPARPAVPALPPVPAQAILAANTKVGQAGLDPFVEKVTQVSPGFFDVEVNETTLTFGASNPRSLDAIRINARNEVVVLAYIHSQAAAGALATALLCPWNHAPLARANPPRAYTVAGYTLSDKSTPSSSLIPKTGIPDDVPVGTVKMNVLFADVLWQNASPPTRDKELLWGVIVPTVTIDGSVAGGTPDKVRLAYGNTLAHELGHVFGLGHRGGGGVPDGLMIPANENLMHPNNPPPRAENIDIIQVKAMRFSEAFFRTP